MELSKPNMFSRSYLAQWGITLILAILVLTPLLPIILQAFASLPLYDARWSFTLSNFYDFASSQSLWLAAGNTVVFAILSTFIAVFIGTIAAILIGRTDLPLRALLGDVFMIPLYLSHLILCIGWMIMYAPGGFIASWLQNFGIAPFELYSMTGMSLVAGVAQAPLVYVYCLYGVAGGAGGALEDAARTVGAGRIQVLCRITLPLMMPALVYSAVLNLIAGFEMLAIPKLLGKTANIETISTFLVDIGIDNPAPNHGLVANGAFLLMILVIISLYFQRLLLKNAFKYTTLQGKAERHRPHRLGRIMRWIVFTLLCLYLAISLVVPIIGVVLRSVTVVLTPLVPIAKVLTMAHIVRLYEESRFFNAIINTIEVGIFSAIFGTLLCVGLVLVAQRSHFRFGAVVDALGQLPRMLPGLIVGLGVFYAAVIFPPFGWLRSSIWILVIAYLMNMIPLGIGVVAPALMQITQDLDKAGRVSGADWLRTVLNILAPLLKPAMAGSFILMFVASLKSYTIAMFLFSPSTEVIGTSILFLASDGDTGLACALATVQILVTLVIVIIARYLMRVRIYG